MTEPLPYPSYWAVLVDQYKIKDQFQKQASTIKLPQFYLRLSISTFGDEEVLLKKEAPGVQLHPTDQAEDRSPHYRPC
ncbi:MAG TPA: hypothetical protein VK404_07260 [Spirosoma sp.]|nr:hypothetical protein [Spirosoma sp.]